MRNLSVICDIYQNQNEVIKSYCYLEYCILSRFCFFQDLKILRYIRDFYNLLLLLYQVKENIYEYNKNHQQ